MKKMDKYYKSFLGLIPFFVFALTVYSLRACGLDVSPCVGDPSLCSPVYHFPL